MVTWSPLPFSVSVNASLKNSPILSVFAVEISSTYQGLACRSVQCSTHYQRSTGKNINDL